MGFGKHTIGFVFLFFSHEFTLRALIITIDLHILSAVFMSPISRLPNPLGFGGILSEFGQKSRDFLAQMTEDGGRRTEGRGQRAEDG